LKSLEFRQGTAVPFRCVNVFSSLPRPERNGSEANGEFSLVGSGQDRAQPLPGESFAGGQRQTRNHYQ
jgi:hypothetical protein